VFPLAGSTAKAFCRLSLWLFKEKSINHFLEHGLLEVPINNRQHASVMEPANGKLEKKAVFSPYCGDEAVTSYGRAVLQRTDGKRFGKTFQGEAS
ncbi:hypothetical protein, partial [Bilophila sp.]|uniref:hypothetical protein n=1 Tax=Bilophila sp. TaxID=1929485 RepID=UPI003078698C